MLGMFKEISLILVVNTKMKQTEKAFCNKNYLDCLKITSRERSPICMQMLKGS